MSDHDVKIKKWQEPDNCQQPPNLGTYYFVHEDTDSDMDKIKQQYTTTPYIEDISTSEITSETDNDDDELRHSKKGHSDSSIDFDTRNGKIECGMPKRKAISENTIKKLVDRADELVSSYGNGRRIGRFGRSKKWRSKEEDSCDASGEDDERESQVSDYEASTTTLRGFNDSHHISKRSTWYCSGQFDQDYSKQIMNNFSISESALDNMNFSPNLLKDDADNITILANGSNSTSSTVEEICSRFSENPSPSRRKKKKAKCLLGKSESFLMASTPNNKSHLLKSCSFPGYSMSLNRSAELTTTLLNKTIDDTSNTSGLESEEEHIFDSVSELHKIGSRSTSNGLLSVDEQPSSLSDVWDNYQFDYSSEPYSESRDSDAARRLINFGEDYRTFIDSPSDWSAFSDVSPTFKRKQFNNNNNKNRNQNEFSLKQILTDSMNALIKNQEIYDKIKKNNFNENEVDQLVSNCSSSIALINKLGSSYKNLSATEQQSLNGLLKQWTTLKDNSLKLQEYLQLDKEMGDLKKTIFKLNIPDKLISFSNVSPLEEIQNEIDTYKNLLSNINTSSEKLARLQAEVNRFSLRNPTLDQLNSKLKNDILELYEHLNNAKTISTEKLELIENLLPQWKILESRLEQLQKDLLDDEKNIDVIDSVLTKGTFSDRTATCVRELAKLLSKSTFNQGNELGDILSEGSFSDSGISDEGSEHEIGERQRRFAAIRRLVRQLESGLPADSAARLKMRDKVNKIEGDLKNVQSRCRSLVVRTSACSANMTSQQKDALLNSFIKGKDGVAADDYSSSINEDPPSWSNSRNRKMFFAIQVIVITFGCLIYLFHPKCCDNMNNYKLSLSPKLHFEGRPPI